MISLATIGTSEICRKFLEAANLTRRFKLEAVYSRKLDTGTAFGKEFGCERVFTSLEELAKCDGICAVYIASPNALHYEQSKLMLENGKHVICEKPIVTSPSEYRELKALADRSGLVYMEAIMPIYRDCRERLKKAVSEIGRVRGANLDFIKRSSRYDRYLAGEQVNIFDKSLKAGALNDLGVYCVFAAIDLFGTPKSLSSFKTLGYNGIDLSGVSVFEYDGFNATLTYSKCAESKSESLICGEDGYITLSSISQYAGIKLCKGGVEREISGILTHSETMAFEIKAFADFIENPAQNRERYAQASALSLNVHTVMEKIRKNAKIIY